MGVKGVVSNLKASADEASDRFPAISLDLIVAAYVPSVDTSPVKDTEVVDAFNFLFSKPLKYK